MTEENQSDIGQVHAKSVNDPSTRILGFNLWDYLSRLQITRGLGSATSDTSGEGGVMLEVQIFPVKETRIRVVMAGRTMTIAKVEERVPQEILVERGVVMLEVQIFPVKETRIRVVMAGRTMTIAKVEEQTEEKYNKITNGMFV